MQNISIKKTLAAGTGAVVIMGSVVAMAAPAFALSTTSSAANQATVQAKLDQAKLKVCQAREKNINSILQRVSKRGNNHLALISDIATKVEAFYTKSGKTVDNYDDLAATVNSDKDAAQSAVSKVDADSNSFTCDSSDPAGTIQGFKADVQAQVSAMQTYKTSVQALIQAVKGVVNNG